ncbi:MAG: serine acetyltransferase, partial [Bacteroidota bacterium]
MKISRTKYYDLRIKDQVADFTKRLVYMLFDAPDQQQVELQWLTEAFAALNRQLDQDPVEIWQDFLVHLDTIRTELDADATWIAEGDPAASSVEEVYLAYPGFYAISVYRLSHRLHQLGLPLIPRIMSEYAHSATGIDIHPGASIGSPFYIDHGTGIVIGATT